MLERFHHKLKSAPRPLFRSARKNSLRFTEKIRLPFPHIFPNCGYAQTYGPHCNRQPSTQKELKKNHETKERGVEGSYFRRGD